MLPFIQYNLQQVETAACLTETTGYFGAENNRLKAANAGLYAAAAAAAVHAADNRWHMSMWLRPVTQEELIAAAAANERQRLHEQEGAATNSLTRRISSSFV
jgi:hypothetical protein